VSVKVLYRERAESMKRPADQAKLLLFALLRSTATALATTGEKTRLVLPQTQIIQLRLATRSDVPSIQRCNLACLPENYNSQFYCSHLRQWPDLALVAEHVTAHPNDKQQQQHRHPFPAFTGSQTEPKIIAYVLAKIETRPFIDYDNPTSAENQVQTLGHVTSLAVQKDFRRLGLAKAMMSQLQSHLQHQGIKSCGLHVRTSNQAACRLYQDDGYDIAQTIPSYYQDGEDAYFMKKMLPAPTNASSGYSMLFGKKIWKTGPETIRLPRIHAIPTEDDQTASESSSGSTVSSPSPELLTGTM
jgi:ribosomal protein S18 acetylase RimI-like enzyme